MAEYYRIKGETLTSIADAIRSKKETTAMLSPEQMAVEIDGIVTGDNLPNAEEDYFCSPTYEYEYAIENYNPTNIMGYTSGAFGAAFTVNKDFSVVGFTIRQADYVSSTIQLWDVTDGTKLASVYSSKGSKPEILLDSPVNLLSGKTYAVLEYNSNTNRPWYQEVSRLTLNSKITFVGSVYNLSATENTVPAPNSVKTWYCGVNLIMSQVITDSVVTEYKIQKSTMNSIADEVKRITGATTELTPAQIITALQGIEAVATE